MTNQEAFNISAGHLLSQMKVSADETNCLYRGPRGLKCAIGCLIPDELYLPEMENNGIQHPIFASMLPTVDRALLIELQVCHDRFAPSSWKEKLRGIATFFKLKCNF